MPERAGKLSSDPFELGEHSVAALAPQPLRTIPGLHNKSRDRGAFQQFEGRRAVAQIDKVRIGEISAIGIAEAGRRDGNESFRMRIRQWSEENRVNKGQDRGRPPD